MIPPDLQYRVEDLESQLTRALSVIETQSKTIDNILETLKILTNTVNALKVTNEYMTSEQKEPIPGLPPERHNANG